MSNFSLMSIFHRFIVSLLLIFGSLTLQGGCSSGDGQLSHRDSVFIKSEAELADLKSKANAGNGDAAWAVFEHYALGMRDQATAEKWLKMADQLGNEKARKYIELLLIKTHHQPIR